MSGTLFNPFGLYITPWGSSAPGIAAGSYTYSSTIDPIANLYAHYAYDSTKANLPVVVLMHGWIQDASTMTKWIMNDMASYGFFVVAVGMRGRNGASGSADASARELHDIIDAIEYVKANFGAFVDPANINVSGYSGGGGNVFGLASKFPDYFRVYASHFGISDYGYDAATSWYALNVNRRAEIESFVGFSPSANLPAYQSRAHQFGVGKNLQGGYLFMFHDSDDNNVQPGQSASVKNQLDTNARTNYTYNLTNAASSPRWLHDSPDANSQVRYSRDIWGPPIKNSLYPAWTIPASGSVKVCGYLKTKLFTIWLGNGTQEVADVTYDTAANSYTVTPLTGPTDVTITQGAKTGSATGITAATVITVV